MAPVQHGAARLQRFLTFSGSTTVSFLQEYRYEPVKPRSARPIRESSSVRTRPGRDAADSGPKPQTSRRGTAHLPARHYGRPFRAPVVPRGGIATIRDRTRRHIDIITVATGLLTSCGPAGCRITCRAQPTSRLLSTPNQLRTYLMTAAPVLEDPTDGVSTFTTVSVCHGPGRETLPYPLSLTTTVIQALSMRGVFGVSTARTSCCATKMASRVLPFNYK